MLGEKYLIPGFEKSEFEISFIHIFNLVEALSIPFGMKNIKNTSRDDLNDKSCDRIQPESALHYYCPMYLIFIIISTLRLGKSTQKVCKFYNS